MPHWEPFKGALNQAQLASTDALWEFEFFAAEWVWCSSVELQTYSFYVIFGRHFFVVRFRHRVCKVKVRAKVYVLWTSVVWGQNRPSLQSSMFLWLILHTAYCIHFFLISYCSLPMLEPVIAACSYIFVIDRVKLSAAPGRTVHTLFAKLCTMVEGHVKRSRTKARSDWSKGGAIALHWKCKL